MRAATTGNMQLYSVIVTKDADMKEKLSPLHFNQPMIKNAPVVLTICADFNRFTKWCECRKATPSYNNLQSFMSAFMDAMCFAQMFCDAAESQGLGTCYIGTTTYNAGQNIDLFKLPQLVVPIITITVGYPDVIPAQSERLPLDAVIHEETYVEYDERLIDKFYSEKESLKINQSFVSENKKETLAQVFTDIRYPKSNNEYFSKTFLEVLQKQGFLD